MSKPHPQKQKSMAEMLFFILDIATGFKVYFNDTSFLIFYLSDESLTATNSRRNH